MFETFPYQLGTFIELYLCVHCELRGHTEGQEKGEAERDRESKVLIPH